MTTPLPGLALTAVSQNYGDHAPKASDLSMAELEGHVKEARALEEKIERLKKEVSAVTREYDHVTQEVIPTKMAACGLLNVTTSGGLKVSIHSEIRAGLPAVSTINKERDAGKRASLVARRNAALDWLIANGHKNLIKHIFKVEFGVDQSDDADAFRRKLSEYRVHGSEGVDVNSQTLSRVVRELHEQHENYPSEILGVYTKTTAKIST